MFYIFYLILSLIFCPFAQAANVYYDEGVFQGAAANVNCVGSTLSCAVSGSTATITGSGSGGTIDISSGTNLSATAPIVLTGDTLSFGNTAVTGITAAGSSASTATVLSGSFSLQEVTTVTSNTGVRLPVATAGSFITVVNRGANVLKVYPATSGTINSQTANFSFLMGIGSTTTFYGKNSTAWYTDGAMRSGTVNNTDAGNSLNILNSGVTASTYGNSASIPQFTVGADGRLTYAAEAGVSISYSQIYNFEDGLVFYGVNRGMVYAAQEGWLVE